MSRKGSGLWFWPLLFLLPPTPWVSVFSRFGLPEVTSFVQTGLSLWSAAARIGSSLDHRLPQSSGCVSADSARDQV